MRLLHTNCVPILYMLSFILTYGAQFKQYCARDSREANVAVNDCICKVFEFNRWLSIRDMPLQAGYKQVSRMLTIKMESIEKLSGTRYIHERIDSSRHITQEIDENCIQTCIWRHGGHILASFSRWKSHNFQDNSQPIKLPLILPVKISDQG